MSDEIITGIDIGSSKTAVLIAKMSEVEKEVRVMGFASVPSQGVRRGQIVDINQVTATVESAVEKAERMAGTKVTSALVGVGGPHIESLNSHGVVAVSQPEVEITQEDVERVVDAARAISISSTREVIEVVPREFIVDGQGGIRNPLGMSGVRLEVNTHIITASLTNIRNIDRCLSDLGIANQGALFSGLCSSLSVLTDTEKELGVIVVDIGGGKTDICMYVEGALSYSSSIPLGGRHITNDLAVGLRVCLESAELIKLFLSKEHKDKLIDDVNIGSLNLPEGITKISSKTAIDGIIRPRLEEIYTEVFKQIEKSGFITAVPSGVVLAGGGAQTVGTLETVRRSMGMPARIGKPAGITGLVDEVLFPQYATVVGLLLYSLDNEPTSGQKINLKDFDKILRNLSVLSSIKKVKNLMKSFMP
ncbi:cell division protein FtsA [Candidatus Roizmanbacteria bacterium RIFCSPHIGHO2_02_FULL_40_13b]|uniref:Cell division protein FtsA n=1 Tax=Candidatus Roizmanbacteria bacterium RIFCSPHIGHO2_01_FULL_39_24 TaxID=1802032 RepID=A0A1F7GL83_9BACT|nr:MAG: cell division protein FtsA [Candidatus Roizmanbacteria bacterium RIFCSPHIGHO2_01_FULL_39_24]OGK28053.1 MAG: cell division protein FtsA [Candidatus Roizmanbacteria bacterium RIFCSPHIGHO2_02_FULL_40_13b]OGK49562.1 MAG: cell division protein FtsA [Candidatus Roizmanbacteria bacterium RIFCSPLOWO2_01_FULL_40_32]OGK56096.1 MAG: cell division protein FtsA [Candidatus Roizmanbacteria bacterium RIFCSPLOWO2_02_FULL_39_8]